MICWWFIVAGFYEWDDAGLLTALGKSIGGGVQIVSTNQPGNQRGSVFV